MNFYEIGIRSNNVIDVETESYSTLETIADKIKTFDKGISTTIIEKRELLESIYQDICKVKVESGSKHEDTINFFLATVGMKYGKTYYGSDYSKCKDLLSKCLAFQYFYTGVESNKEYDITHKTLKDWESESSLIAFEELLPEISADLVLEKLKGHSVDQIFVTAHTLRMLGHAFKNITAYDSERQKHGKLFESIYGASESLLKRFEKEDDRCYKELTDLYYNTRYYLHLIKDPNDIKGAQDAFDIVLERTNDPVYKANVINMKICLDKNVNKDTLLLMQEVIDIRQEIVKNEGGYVAQFLLANALNNYAISCLKFEGRDEEQLKLAEKYVKEACQFAEDSKTLDKHLDYYGVYYQVYAKLHHLLGRKEEALKCCEKAIELFEKAGDCEEDLEAIEKLLKEINQ